MWVHTERGLLLRCCESATATTASDALLIAFKKGHLKEREQNKNTELASQIKKPRAVNLRRETQFCL